MAGSERHVDQPEEMEETDHVEDLEEQVRQQELQKQSEEERRAVRSSLSEIRDEMLANRENATSDDFLDFLERIDHNFSKVHTPREAVKDAENIRLLSEMQRQKMTSYDFHLVQFLPGEFAENLKKYSVERLKTQRDRDYLTADTWSLLGKHCQHYFQKSPALHFMCGAFERNKVVKKVVPRARKPRDNEPGRVTELKQLESFKETSKNEATTKEVEEVLKTLWRLYDDNDRSPICYFEFVMNPFSFGKSVENIFYVSFLARDGYVQIDLDEDRLPVLMPVEGSNENRKREARARQQLVISITPSKWKEIIKTFKITQPLLRCATVNGTGDHGQENIAQTSWAT